MQVRDSGEPPTVRVREELESSWIVMLLLLAVNPLTVAGVEGRSSGTPLAGTGDGMVTLKLKGPWGVVAGVAPVASIVVFADPSRFGCIPAAAFARACGMLTVVW